MYNIMIWSMSILQNVHHTKPSSTSVVCLVARTRRICSLSSTAAELEPPRSALHSRSASQTWVSPSHRAVLTCSVWSQCWRTCCWREHWTVFPCMDTPVSPTSHLLTDTCVDGHLGCFQVLTYKQDPDQDERNKTPCAQNFRRQSLTFVQNSSCPLLVLAWWQIKVLWMFVSILVWTYSTEGPMLGLHFDKQQCSKAWFFLHVLRQFMPLPGVGCLQPSHWLLLKQMADTPAEINWQWGAHFKGDSMDHSIENNSAAYYFFSLWWVTHSITFTV